MNLTSLEDAGGGPARDRGTSSHLKAGVATRPEQSDRHKAHGSVDPEAPKRTVSYCGEGSGPSRGQGHDCVPSAYSVSLQQAHGRHHHR